MRVVACLAAVEAMLLIGCASSPPPPPPDAEPTEVAAPDPVAPEPTPETNAVASAPAPEPTAEPKPTVEPPPEPAPAEPKAAGVPGANLTMGSVSADGLQLEDVSCKADGLGFLGAVLIAGSLSKKKGPLQQCTGGKSPRVFWSFSGGKITKARAEGVDEKASACVGRTLTGSAAPGTGDCAATLKF